jgi:hypothetical protein
MAIEIVIELAFSQGRNIMNWLRSNNLSEARGEILSETFNYRCLAVSGDGDMDAADSGSTGKDAYALLRLPN